MSTTQTTNLVLDKPGVGDTGWGTVLNGTLDRVDTILSLKGTSNPTGVTTPDYIGQHFIDTANAKAYVAKGATSADWVLLNAAVSPHHNICINGAFEVWQRGNAATTASVGVYNYLADRIFVRPSGALITQERTTTATLSGTKTRYALRLNGQSAGTTTVEVGQRIEAANVPQLRPDGFTVSCWVYNNSGSAYSPTFEVKSAGAEDTFTSLTLEATLSPGISCTNAAWTRVYATVTASTVAGWTGGTANGLQIALVIPDGYMRAGHVNLVAEFQIQEGTTLTVFLPRLASEIIDLCQRYYYKTYDLDVLPGTITDGGVVTDAVQVYGQGPIANVLFPVPMCKTPSVSVYSPVTGTVNYLRCVGANEDVSATQYAASKKGAIFIATSVPSSTSWLKFHAVADGEL